LTKLQLESVDKWASEAAPLVIAHWRELGLDQDLKIDPDVAKMRKMEEIGMFKTITARNEGVMVGYLLAIFATHLHYRSSPPMFIVDAYYVAPDARNGTGVKLIRFMESTAKALGAIKIYISCKIHRDHTKLFESLGYQMSDYAFIKRI
jgi:N-acetylglutamate synthase-like GNAT family acetyltransferase